MAGPSTRVSVLHEISIYTEDDAVPVSEVMFNIKKNNAELAVSSKSDDSDLMAFLKSVVPDFNEERVYPSDVKKLVSWYSIINETYPDLLVEPKEEEKKEEEEKPEAKKAAPKAKAEKEEGEKKVTKAKPTAKSEDKPKAPAKKKAAPKAKASEEKN